MPTDLVAVYAQKSAHKDQEFDNAVVVAAWLLLYMLLVIVILRNDSPADAFSLMG